MENHRVCGIGGKSILFLDINGHVWGLGCNELGELGEENVIPKKHNPRPSYLSLFFWKLGPEEPPPDPGYRLQPHLNPNLQNIVSIACGWDHSLCLDAQGEVWAFGNNSHGQLGLPDVAQPLYIPKRIPELQNIVSITCSTGISLALSESGEVWAFGNYRGTLRDQESYEPFTYPQKIKKLPRIIAMACGSKHYLFLTETGTVLGRGCNDDGQLGYVGATQDIYLSDIVAIAASENYSLALDTDGKVFSFGCAEYFPKVTGPKELEDIPRIKEIHASSQWAAFLTEEHKIIFFGSAPSDIPPAWDEVEKIVSSFNNIVVYARDATVWIWGSMEGGQLGTDYVSHTNAIYLHIPPVRISEYHESLFTHKKIFAKSARK